MKIRDIIKEKLNQDEKLNKDKTGPRRGECLSLFNFQNKTNRRVVTM
ncbi:hypothetical protein ACJDU8_22465 [Clostridium sp. WILCCON 0269]|uniref:Uncharacterized protein n=1 Tax=Candidatus Clostridium eludens TaxID=3381663 RepID=A0ABW8SRJ6_9CLOT